MEFASQLKAGDVIGLFGDLGSGKTTFVKGLAKGLGLKDTGDVKSPTYVLMHIYPTRIPLHHFDLYRLSSGDDLDTIGFEEFMNEAVISCVEWADKALDRFPVNAYHIYFRTRRDGSRSIEIRQAGTLTRKRGLRS